MKPDYSDITDQAGEPDYWDDRGVPRYESFGPEQTAPGTDHVALMRVGCQACTSVFRVAVERNTDRLRKQKILRTQTEIAPEEFSIEKPDPPEDPGIFLYKDPPRHDCATGAVMTTIPLEVLQFCEKPGMNWIHRDDCTGKLDHSQCRQEEPA